MPKRAINCACRFPLDRDPPRKISFSTNQIPTMLMLSRLAVLGDDASGQRQIAGVFSGIEHRIMNPGHDIYSCCIQHHPCTIARLPLRHVKCGAEFWPFGRLADDRFQATCNAGAGPPTSAVSVVHKHLRPQPHGPSAWLIMSPHM